MKNLILFLISFIFLISCEETKKDREAMLPASSGNINNLQVIIEDDLWTGPVGEAIRQHFASPIVGLPQEEPKFNINQLSPASFDGFTQKHRIFLFIQKGEETNFRIATNHYAKPQKGVFISAGTNEELIDLIDENAIEILRIFNEMEITEKQRRISLSLLNVKPLIDSLQVTIEAPSAYRIAKVTKDFAWLRKDIRTGTTNIMIYEMPWDSFKDEQTRVGDIIRMRDSIGNQHIEGPIEGSYMITEAAFAPYLSTSEIDGRFAYETKGTWEVKNYFMAGPFVNYIVKDSINNRLLVFEGFTFAPSVSKRDYQFELEAIIRSAKIK